jgi:hypothetical protein
LCPRTVLSRGPFCPRDVSVQNFRDVKSIEPSVRGRFVRATDRLCYDTYLHRIKTSMQTQSVLNGRAQISVKFYDWWEKTF